MEDVIDADYTHANTVCKKFEIKNLGEHHDLSKQYIIVSWNIWGLSKYVS